MTWPQGVDTVTVTGLFVHPDGSPYRGSVAFTIAEPVSSAEHDVIVQGTLVSPLDTEGRLTVTLLATDAAGFEPSGWVYRVDERWEDAPPRAYRLGLPAAVPEVVLPGV